MNDRSGPFLCQYRISVTGIPYHSFQAPFLRGDLLDGLRMSFFLRINQENQLLRDAHGASAPSCTGGLAADADPRGAYGGFNKYCLNKDRRRLHQSEILPYSTSSALHRHVQRCAIAGNCIRESRAQEGISYSKKSRRRRLKRFHNNPHAKCASEDAQRNRNCRFYTITFEIRHCREDSHTYIAAVFVYWIYVYSLINNANISKP